MKYLFLALILATPVSAEEWFQHKFGELRAFHGDWLAICNDKGTGPCRAVQSSINVGGVSVFDRRLAIHMVDGSKDLVIEFMDRDLPLDVIQTLTFSIDEVPTSYTTDQWVGGAYGVENVVDTLQISNPTLASELVANLSRGRQLSVTYSPKGLGDGVASFPLRGLPQAIRAIERHMEKRGN